MSVEIPVAKGIDVYIFEGENILDIVSQYNMFSGGGCDVPEWGLGFLYRANAKSTGDDIIALAKYFRDNDVPCDIIGLEPGVSGAGIYLLRQCRCEKYFKVSL